MILIVAAVTSNKCNKRLFVIFVIMTVAVVVEHGRYDPILIVPIFYLEFLTEQEEECVKIVFLDKFHSVYLS